MQTYRSTPILVCQNYKIKTLLGTPYVVQPQVYGHIGMPNRFAEGLLAIVRAGGDADTNAAVSCAILGAKFGYNTIPTEYIDGLIYKDQLDDVIKGISSLVLH